MKRYTNATFCVVCMVFVFTTDAHPISKPSGTNVLLLDVDNCLYSEKELLLNTGCGIEEQIVKNTHNFGQRYFNLSKNECDEMYHDYGSTVEGLRQILVEGGETSENVNDILERFYQEVYEDIDLSSLLLSTREQTNFTTGYSHGMKKRQFLQDLLSHSRDPKFIVSNSPVHHVLKVLRALGLHEVNFDGIVTPDTVENSKLGYPTKHSPQEYYKTIIEKFDIQSDRITLLDDSLTNLKKAAEVGFHGIRVNGKDEQSKLESALSVVMGHGVEEVGQENPSYTFTDTKYLESKNEVDVRAINEMVWERLGQELSSRIEGSSEVRIVDVGAGLLSMLELVMHGGAGKKSLVNLSGVKGTINYIAYESNHKLLATCFDRLQALGFVEDEVTRSNKDEYIFTREKSEELDVNIRVSLRMSNFLDDEESCDQYSPHLIIGCCFADLFDPNDLAASFQRFANKYQIGSENLGTSDILIYLPITFEGTTQLIPPKPFGAKNGRLIPSDTAAFQLYADSLTKQHGHNLDPRKLVYAIRCIGGQLLTQGKSIWDIDFERNEYLWKTMLHFFGLSAAPEILRRRWNARAWMERVRKERQKIRVVNTDLLFSLPYKTILKNEVQENDSPAQGKTLEKIFFTGPYNVSKTSSKLKIELQPGEVEIKSLYSLISSGTELKIFKGMFGEASLDVNIPEMADESMKYPLSYGYSLVGVVVQCAPDVPDANDIIGRHVFAFSPHSSRAILDRSSIHLVPNGINPEDAIFFPSVETALSIVHDANIRIGENLAIFGQGIIGLLVTALLSKDQLNFKNRLFGSVTVFDTLNDRLAMASAMGSNQALLPDQATKTEEFDVCIEVSGNFRALQSAIDSTKTGGRIIIGSWYGDSSGQLRLGIDFHRSHKVIKTSQVSTIPAELSTLWSKERRFALTWELVQILKPSRLITKKVTLDEAQLAYELLDEGKEIAIAFQYD